MKVILNNVSVKPNRANVSGLLMILALFFTHTIVVAQTFILYQLPADAGYSGQKLNKELAPLKSLADVEKTVRVRIPKFTGELIVLCHIKGSLPFMWIMTDAKKISRFQAPILGDQPGPLINYSDLEKVYFKDTIIVLDSLLIDITQAVDFTRYNFNDFYFRMLNSKPTADSATSKIYRVPTNQYKKLNIRQELFGPDAREYISVEVFNVLLPDKIYGRCIIYFPSQAFKNDLLKKARFLRDNAGFTLPDITGVISIDLQRRGTLYYKPLLNWLRTELATRN